MLDGTAGNYEESVMTQPIETTKDFILSLSQEKAKELIQGYASFHDDFYVITPRFINRTCRYDIEDKIQSENLLGELNYQFKCLYGKFAF
jgi:hypothetical protein